METDWKSKLVTSNFQLCNQLNKELMSKSLAITDDTVINKIYQIRGKKVMLDRDLAEMYGVETKILNQAVKRNEKRFPT
jgi:hypothetical protein